MSQSLYRGLRCGLPVSRQRRIFTRLYGRHCGSVKWGCVDKRYKKILCQGIHWIAAACVLSTSSHTIATCRGRRPPSAIGRAQVGTPDTQTHTEYRILLEEQ